ncbi:MAG: ferritin family protein [Faecalimonas sp.]|nr:ferritin family protein [Faecalimonas sp.]
MGIQFKDSQTKVNLMKAFAGESQARNRYTFAAEEAREQGLYAIQEVFLFTANQERAHAERFYDLLKSLSGETIEICGGFPVDKQDTVEGLLEAAQHNEYEEADDVYIAFGNTAKEEGFMEVASAFFQIAEIEKIHGNRFGQLAEMLKDGTYFETKESEKWMCLNCGNIHTGKKLPGVCPVCRYEKGYFIPLELAPYKTKELN